MCETVTAHCGITVCMTAEKTGVAATLNFTLQCVKNCHQVKYLLEVTTYTVNRMSVKLGTESRQNVSVGSDSVGKAGPCDLFVYM